MLFIVSSHSTIWSRREVLGYTSTKKTVELLFPAALITLFAIR
jgi:hypothetical protein